MLYYLYCLLQILIEKEFYKHTYVWVFICDRERTSLYLFKFDNNHYIIKIFAQNVKQTELIS